MKIVYAEPCYTGGGINTFIGEIDNGRGRKTYFIADDNNFDVRIVSEPTYHQKEECWFANWQEKHLIKDLTEDQAVIFFEDMLSWIEEHKPDEYKYLDMPRTYANLQLHKYDISKKE